MELGNSNQQSFNQTISGYFNMKSKILFIIMILILLASESFADNNIRNILNGLNIHLGANRIIGYNTDTFGNLMF